MKYKCTVTQAWIETGTIEIEADSEDEAREVARQMLMDGDESIQWGEMDPQESLVESVEEIDGHLVELLTSNDIFPVFGLPVVDEFSISDYIPELNQISDPHERELFLISHIGGLTKIATRATKAMHDLESVVGQLRCNYGKNFDVSELEMIEDLVGPELIGE